MGSCAAPSAKGDDKFITTDYLQQCHQLLHIFLTLNEDLLRHRIANQTMHPDPNRNAEIREWRLANVARCLAARERLPCTTRVLDSGAHTSDELAAMVLDGIDGRT